LNRNCPTCRLFRVFLLGVGGAVAGIWLAPRIGYHQPDMLLPAAIGVLVALAIGGLFTRPRP
jgi:uncharacterized membrane protein YeaQ/YmgE (transglycosylase-associated protein family)